MQIPVLADIVERDIVTLPSLPSLSASQNGFPQVLKLDDITKNSSTTNGQDGDNRPSKRTLFSQQFQKMKQELSKDVSRINENMSSGSQQSSIQENKRMGMYNSHYIYLFLFFCLFLKEMYYEIVVD